MQETNRTYLDYNATSIVRPAAIDVVVSTLQTAANASSVHHFGAKTKGLLDSSRATIASYIGANPDDLVFTSGGTESNVAAIFGTRRRKIVSSIEHDSVLVPASRSSNSLDLIPVNSEGLIDLQALKELLAKDSSLALVSIMLANNETGIIQPVSEAAEIARKYGALIHCDAVQGLGKLPIDVEAMGPDIISFSAHKIGGPQGVGALWIKSGTSITPLLFGGNQEMSRRAGTENVSGIAGFSAALESIASDEPKRMLDYRKRLEERLGKVAPVIIFGSASERLPNTLCFSTPGLGRELQLASLDMDGIGVSSGSACSSGKVSPSHVLEAMGVPEEIAACAIRLSVGWATTDHDIDVFFESWSRLYARNKSRPT